MKAPRLDCCVLLLLAACASAPRPPTRALPRASERASTAAYEGELYVLHAGDPSAPALVLVHGLGERASADFAPVVEALSARYYVIVPDLPGFGASPAAGHSLHPSDYAELVVRLMSERARQQGHPVHLLGHSMGGTIAALVAGRHPELVDRLILVDAAGILHREAYAASQFIDPLRGLSGTSVPVGMMETLLAIGRSVEPDPESILQSPRLRHALLGDDPNKVAALSLIVTDVGPALSRVRAPTLLIWGADDHIAPMRNARVLLGRIQGAHLVSLPGVGHVPMTDDSSRFVELVMAHLRGDEVDEPPARAEHGDVHCEHEDGLVLEGDYGRVVLDECEDVTIRGGTLRELVLHDSTVSLDGVWVRNSEGAAVRSRDSVLRMDGGGVEAPVGMVLDGSRLDVAGAQIIGGEHALLVRGDPSRALFSATRVQSGGHDREVHGEVVLAAD